MNIGSRLKQILAERDMTVSQLSRESGVPAQTLYAMINRDSNKADMDIMAKMLMALDMDLMEFLELEVRPGKKSKAVRRKISNTETNPEKPAGIPDTETNPEEPAEEPAPRSYRRDLEDYLL